MSKKKTLVQVQTRINKSAEYSHRAVGPIEIDCAMAQRIGWTQEDIDQEAMLIGIVSRHFTERARLLLTLATPITLTLHRAFAAESFQIQASVLRVLYPFPAQDANGFVHVIVDGIIADKSKRCDIYELSNLGGARTIQLRANQVNAIVDC